MTRRSTVIIAEVDPPPVARRAFERLYRTALAVVTACAILALTVPALRAQSGTEVWQVVAAIPSVSGVQPLQNANPSPGLSFPTGIAADASGHIAVADTWNNLVRVFDADGAESLTIGRGADGSTGGQSLGQLNSPAQVKFDASGQLIATDTYNSRVQVFSSTGAFMFAVSTAGWPWGVALSPGTTIGQPTGTADPGDAHRIAIVNSYVNGGQSAGYVSVYDSHFNRLFDLGTSGAGQLSAPLAVAIDPSTGNFLVTESEPPARVMVYDSSGQYRFSFLDSVNDTLGFPLDVAIDPSGRVAVADAFTSVVDFFDVDYDNATASVEMTISAANTPILFLAPGGIAFDQDGRLYVTTGTWATDGSGPEPSTQFVLIFDRPSLAISNVIVKKDGVPVTTVQPGDALTITGTLSVPTGSVTDVTVSAKATDWNDVDSALGGSPATVGTVVAGETPTVSFTAVVPSTTTGGGIRFTLTADGTVASGTAESGPVETTSLPVPVQVVPLDADATAPTSTATLTPATPQGAPWYTAPVTVTITATDDPGGVGVKQIEYYFTGAQLADPSSASSANFPKIVSGAVATTIINNDNTSTIHYRAVDNNGNLEPYHALTVQVDQTPPYVIFNAPSPTPSYTVPGSGARWWNSNVTIPFAAQDASSGVQTSTPPAALTFTAEGAGQTQVVKVVDKAGNRSDALIDQGPFTSPVVNIDRTAPVAGTPMASPAAPNASGWYNTRVDVTFTASDALSGFRASDATTHLDGGLAAARVVTFASDGRNLSAGSQTFADLAGNVSLPATYPAPINIDRTPPTITGTSYVSTANPSQTLSPNASGWFNALVTVRLTATDNLSGFAAADATTGVAGGLQGVKSLPLAEGRHTASSLAITDLAGNSASAPVSAVDVDVTAPAVAAPVFVDRETGTTASPSAAGWYRGQVDVTFAATDGLSGFSGGATEARSFALAADQANQMVAVPTFTDLAGNTSSGYAGNPGLTVLGGINVDSTAPQVQVVATASPAWTDPDTGRVWFNAPVSVSFTATDALSGFAGGTPVVSVTQSLGDGTDDLASQAFTDLAGNTSTGSFGPVSVDTTAPTVTANIAPNGNGETVSFDATDAGSGVASCTISVDGVTVQNTCDPIALTASDSGKTVTATVVDRVGNTSTTKTHISFGPPEAYNQFDPVTHDVLVYGFDPATGASLGVIPPASVYDSDSDGVICVDQHGHQFGPFPADWWHTWGGSDGSGLRVYHIVGASGDALTLVESVKLAGSEAQVLVIGFQYTVNGTTEPFIFAPFATKKFQWSENGDGSLKTLNQDMTIGTGPGRVEVQANYRSDRNQTTVHTKISGPDAFATLDGLALLQMATNRAGSDLVIQADGIAPVPGPAGTLDPRNGGFWWGGSHGGDSASQGSDQGHHDDGDHHEADHGNHQDGDRHDSDHNHGDHHQNHAPVVTISNLTSHEGEIVAVQVQATDADGDALVYAATGLPAGISMTAAGAISGTLSDTTAGTYPVVVTATDPKGLSGSASFVWTVVDVNRAPIVAAANQTSHENDTVSVQMAGQDPDGDAITYTATGLPPGLTLDSGTGLITGHLDFESAGAYVVTVTAADAGALHGSITFSWIVVDVPRTPSPAGAARIRHAPSLSGSSIVTGSLQIMSAKSFTLNGGAKVTGALFVPGMPTVQINSTPAHFGGTVDGEGAPSPAGYVVTLNGGTWLDQLVRRTDPVALPVVAPPPAPTGSRSVSVGESSNDFGSFLMIRNLTLNGSVGAVAVPAGTYGSFTANGNNSFVLGQPGATTPAVYNFQTLTLNGSSRITIVGPVVITLANGIALSGSIGDPAHPEWLTLQIASGGVELNSGVTVAGEVVAPAGTVTIDGDAQLIGGVAADHLTLDSRALLTLITQ